MYRIASYNVMADVFSPPSQFPHLAPERVGWMYRGARIAGEILKVNPTILCLQELGVDEEGAHIRPFLARSGYEGVYKPNAWKEGCAVFWQTHAYAILCLICRSHGSSFEKVETRSFDYPTLAKALLMRAKESNDIMVVKLCEEVRFRLSFLTLAEQSADAED